MSLKPENTFIPAAIQDRMNGFGGKHNKLNGITLSFRREEIAQKDLTRNRYLTYGLDCLKRLFSNTFTDIPGNYRPRACFFSGA
jgi:hypothetical protein